MPIFEVEMNGKVYEVDAPDPQTASRSARLYSARQSASQPVDKAEAARMALEGMGPLEKTRANIGAGLHSFAQGARQLLSPLLNAPTDEEIKDTRLRDKVLADSTDTGTGADWLPTAGKVGQFVGETLPAMMIPGGVGTGVAGRVLPSVQKTILGSPVRAGITGGAITGMTAPTVEGESRVLNTALGAGIGGAVPATFQAARSGVQFFNNWRSPENRAANVLRRALGDEADQVAQAALARQASRPQSTASIPETLAEATGNERAAALQKVAATQSGPAWEKFARTQNVETQRVLDQMTAPRNALDALVAHRRQVTDPLREDVMDIIRRRYPGGEYAQPVSDFANTLRTSASPEVQRVARYVLQTTDPVIPITPERMYEMSKVLEQKMGKRMLPGDMDELASAAKGALVQTKALRDATDEALDFASAGTFMPYQQEFARLSRPVNEAAALKDIFESINKPGARTLGDVPEVTRSNLASAYEAHAAGPFGLNLSPQADSNLRDLLSQLQRREQVSQSYRGGVQGVMSDGTGPSVIGGIAGQATGSPGYGYINTAREFISRLNNKSKIELAKMLQDPAAAARAIQQSTAANQRMSPAMETMARLLGIAAAGSTN